MVFEIGQLHRLRGYELGCVVSELPRGASVLEIGAGTGHQARALCEMGFRVTAIDLANSTYARERVYPVIDYDGRKLPVPTDTIDVVFSSNVLEHVKDLATLHKEIRRVLKLNGFCVHLMPTPTWRTWTTISGWLDIIPAIIWSVRHGVAPRAYNFVKAVAGRVLLLRHGARGSALSELWTFSETWWRREFGRHGFVVRAARPGGVFYTGFMLFGEWLSIEHRRALARWLGSACNIYIVSPVSRDP